jgi:flagellar basal body-associated protein FliL
MSGVVTIVIILVILAVIGVGVWYFMSSNMSSPFGSQEGGSKKHMKHNFFHHNKINLILALISVYIIYSIFIKY